MFKYLLHHNLHYCLFRQSADTYMYSMLSDTNKSEEQLSHTATKGHHFAVLLNVAQK